jgi:hypothetical protein
MIVALIAARQDEFGPFGLKNLKRNVMGDRNRGANTKV